MAVVKGNLLFAKYVHKTVVGTHTVQATSSHKCVASLKRQTLFCFDLFFWFDFVLSLRACSLQLNFTHLLKQGPFLLMGHPVIIRPQNQMLLGCMHVYAIYLYVHSALYIERNFVISSRGVSRLSNKMATRCQLNWNLQQTIFAFTKKQNSIIWGPSKVSITAKYGFWCPLHVSSGKIVCFILL